MSSVSSTFHPSVNPKPSVNRTLSPPLVQELQAEILDVKSEAASLCELLSPDEKRDLLVALKVKKGGDIESCREPLLAHPLYFACLTS